MNFSKVAGPPLDSIKRGDGRVVMVRWDAERSKNSALVATDPEADLPSATWPTAAADGQPEPRLASTGACFF
jgi:hypothetical protein